VQKIATQSDETDELLKILSGTMRIFVHFVSTTRDAIRKNILSFKNDMASVEFPGN
jgi:hypothetical protein